MASEGSLQEVMLGAAVVPMERRRPCSRFEHMGPSTNNPVYVFVSDDRDACAFSTQEDGANVPPPTSGSHWTRRDVIMMDEKGIHRYVFDADIAIANLRAKGYHISKMCVEVLPFRKSSVDR
jgi:hypothetical protein